MTPAPKHFWERFLPPVVLLMLNIVSISYINICSLKGKLGLHQRSIKATTLMTRSCLNCFHSGIRSLFGSGCDYVIMSLCEESGVCGILCLVRSVLPHPAHSNNRQQLCRLLQESALEKRGFWPPLNSFKQKLMKRLDYLLVDPLIAAR